MRILAVDSDDDVRTLCARALAPLGHEVHACASGAAAAARLGEPWDMVIVDAGLPGELGGMALMRRVRALGTADVLLLASDPRLEQALAALHEGAYDLLQKPVPATALLGAARRCEEKRRLSKDLERERGLRAQLDRANVELTRMRRVQETFGQFITPEIAQFVMEHPPDFMRLGQTQVVSVLFADVRDFTPFSERVVPDEAVVSLNEVLSYVIAAVLRERGIVNKFTGDGIMAVFGAPLPLADHAQAAARAALWARESVEVLAGMRRDLKLEYLRLGFGVNSGQVLAGCLGNRERAEYSVFGHAVNLAARLEQAAAPGQILIGPGSVPALEGAFRLKKSRLQRFPGIAERIPVRELLGLGTPGPGSG